MRAKCRLSSNANRSQAGRAALPSAPRHSKKIERHLERTGHEEQPNGTDTMAAFPYLLICCTHADRLGQLLLDRSDRAAADEDLAGNVTVDHVDQAVGMPAAERVAVAAGCLDPKNYLIGSNKLRHDLSPIEKRIVIGHLPFVKVVVNFRNLGIL
jgi:hypothetical protein